jgi:hypothetical protein
MFSDPVTLGISGFDTVFNRVEQGPGARNKYTQQADVVIGGTSEVTVQQQELVISHAPGTAKGRSRSLFRLDLTGVSTASLANGLENASFDGSCYLVLDLPDVKSVGGAFREIVAKHLLARMLGFLSENATGAPDFDFSSNELVLKFLSKES